MAHPFTNMNRSVGFRFNPATPSRVILVAVNSEILPPIFHQETVLQRMRVVSVPPDQPDDLEPANQLPGVFKRPLPPMPRQQAPVMHRARLVRGEILHDNEGRMYEKSGNNIRPLQQQLVSGPQGQVFELFRLTAPPRNLQASETHFYPESFAGESSTENRHQTAQSSSASDFPPLSSPSSPERDASEHLTIAQPDEHSPAAPYLKLFPDPGLRRLIRFGDFKSLLTPQLRQPERLRDSHWLPCYLQVYEARLPQQLDSLTATAVGDPKLARQFQFLSDALARRLGLGPLAKPLPPTSPGMRRPGDILPNERVFRLQVESDPTRDNSPLRDDNESGNPANPRRSMRAPDSNAPSSGALKKSIPDRMIKAWEFRISREEALYDMTAAKTFAGYLRSLLHRLKASIGGRGEMKKWRLFLSGKSADEQLWVVRPPSAGLCQSRIREWARKTLEAAGYDSQAMLLEWEIFWRRKGV